jgi:DNA-binding MarR family transcriptional regulator
MPRQRRLGADEDGAVGSRLHPDAGRGEERRAGGDPVLHAQGRSCTARGATDGAAIGLPRAARRASVAGMSKPQPASPAPTAPGETPAPAGPLRSPLNHRPAFLARLAQLRSFDEFYRRFAGLGVTPAQFSVLALVVANPGVRPGAIAEDLRIKPSNVAAVVNALVAAGLVARSQDATELRASLLPATPAGERAWRDMERACDATDAGFLEGLSPEEAGQLTALLRKLLHR